MVKIPFDSYRNRFKFFLNSALFSEAGSRERTIPKYESFSNISFVNDEAEAVEYMTSIEWDNALNDMSNSFRRLAGEVDRQKADIILKNLNEIAIQLRDDFRLEVDGSIFKKISTNMHEALNLADDFLSFCQEDYVFLCGYKIQRYWKDIVSIYEYGRVPCGWLGRFPDGDLLIY